VLQRELAHGVSWPSFDVYQSHGLMCRITNSSDQDRVMILILHPAWVSGRRGGRPCGVPSAVARGYQGIRTGGKQLIETICL